jgi:LAS superfamily LD-carboxypeptidase LdcB
MMSFKKELLFFIIAFWLICFYVGFQYSNTFKSIFKNNNILKTEQTSNVIGTPQTAENKAYQDIKPVIQQIDPSDMETMMLEIYSSDTGNESFSAYTTENNLLGCTQFNPNERTTVNNPQDLLAFVNKQHKIDGAYTPDDLVAIANYGVPTFGNIYVRREVAEKFTEMYKEMTKAGLKVSASSGWRSLAHQQKVLDNWTKMVGAGKANNYAAIPGYSEHHLGTAIDILTPENGNTVSPSYFNTRVFKWMSENSYKYGFLLSYPRGKESITGYNAEGWHYRYVGVSTATQVHNQNTTLTEFLFAVNNICF